MTRLNSAYLLHRASERVSAGAAAIALTCLTLLTVDTRASEPRAEISHMVPASVTVSYSDVAFGNTAGAADVYRKLKTAARKVCGMTNGAQTLDERAAAKQCFDAALAEAVLKIDRPTLTALHAAEARKFG